MFISLSKASRRSFWGVIPIQTRLFGLEGGERLHLWGTDDLGRDVFSRTLYATRTSLSIGVLGGADLFQLGAADWGNCRICRRLHRQRHPARDRGGAA